MRIDRHLEFITESERGSLIDWMDNSGKLVKGLSRGEYDYTNRITTRLNNEVILFPKEAYDIRKRLMDKYGFNSRDVGFIAHGEGMIAVKTFEGGDTYKHTDPCSGDSHQVTMNVLLQKSTEGGLLHVSDEPVPLEERELHCYIATKYEHFVTECSGDTRYMWIFRFNINPDKWELGE
jgi:hypothetical protein